MTIRKDYHFYAAHRNEMLFHSKCRNLHGHTYHVTVEVQGLIADEDSGISLLFEDLDNIVEPIIKSLDHSLLIHKTDKLLPYLLQYCAENDDQLKMIQFDGPTSVENLTEHIRARVLPALKKLGLFDFGLAVYVKETVSSTIIL